jgi:hypothetical protein
MVIFQKVACFQHASLFRLPRIHHVICPLYCLGTQPKLDRAGLRHFAHAGRAGIEAYVLGKISAQLIGVKSGTAQADVSVRTYKEERQLRNLYA